MESSSSHFILFQSLSGLHTFVAHAAVSKHVCEYCQGPDTRRWVFLSSFVSLVWCTDFHTFHKDQWISCHTMGDKNGQEAGSWNLSPALIVSELSWWRYFFKLSDLIAGSGPWYFQVCQGHSTLRTPQKPFDLWVLVLISKKQLSCNKCLLRVLPPCDIVKCFIHSQQEICSCCWINM